LRVIVQDFGWIHHSIGLFGNINFFLGSILFLKQLEEYKMTGVWMFIVGSFGMMIGAIGRLLVDIWSE
jgi:hypothetical protein